MITFSEGWSQTSQGYLVSLINSKDPKGRITISHRGCRIRAVIQVLEVERDPMNYKATKVLVQAGVDKRWIGYEDKFLTLQQPPAAKPAVRNAGREADSESEKGTDSTPS